MGIYGKQIHEDTELINEGFKVKLSKDAEKLKKELQEEINKYNEKYDYKSIDPSLGRTYMPDTYKDIQAKVEKLIRSKFNKLFISNLIVSDLPVSYQLSIQYYYQSVVALYNNKLYRIEIQYHPSSAKISMFKELDLENCVIPIDILENVLSWCRKDYILGVSKNKISLANISPGKFDYSMFDKIAKYCDNKHPEIKYKINKASKYISFKKSSK